MPPNNPFAGFTPQQAASYMQQQRFAAFQRQMQEQMGHGMNRGQFPTNTPVGATSSADNTNSSTTDAAAASSPADIQQPKASQSTPTSHTMSSPSQVSKDPSTTPSNSSVPGPETVEKSSTDQPSPLQQQQVFLSYSKFEEFKVELFVLQLVTNMNLKFVEAFLFSHKICNINVT